MSTMELNNLWAYIQGLGLVQSDREWLASKLVEPTEKGWADRFAGSWKEMDDQMLDAALAEFSGDFGGKADSGEIARELRQGAEMVRDIKTW